jgi:putative redox protein
LGGHDSGFNPHELLEGALAACTIITGQMYADRKGYKLDSIDVTVKVISEGPESKIDCEVHYRGDLSDDEKKRLTEIINKCPIHKLLESHIQIQMTTT